MKKKIKTFINEYNMLEHGDTVICGLSGGADSVCLLLTLNELSKDFGIEVKALHVNHHLRGEESNRDEEFCRQLCKKNNIPFTSVNVDVIGYAQKNSLSIEDSARRLRYAAFKDNSDNSKIATAHNANDNLETVILNLTRGTAIKGLAGIPPVRDNIIRPLLTLSRSEIEKYLASKNQTYVTDSTNLSDNYTRNKIRHKILPLLEEINTSAVETSVNSISAVRSENDLIEAETRKALLECRNGNKLIGAERFHKVIRRRCISRLLAENSLPYSHDRLEEADNILVNGGKINVSGDFFLVSDGKIFELTHIPRSEKHENISVPMKIGENKIFPDKYLFCQLAECDNLKKIETVHKKLTFNVLDYDKIIGRAVVRNRKFGDRIQLSGRSFTSSVKKLINENIPKETRGSLHFIEDEQGLIFAENIGIAQRVVPDNNTVNFLVISVKHY